MCFVLDANCFHLMLTGEEQCKRNFAPLLDWLDNEADTSMVMGGEQYKKELRAYSGCLKLMIEYANRRKLSWVVDAAVDSEERRLKQIIPAETFDDAHLLAITNVSGCRIIASHDKKAMKYIKKKELYQAGARAPSFYQNDKHVGLLKKENIVSLKHLDESCPVILQQLSPRDPKKKAIKRHATRKYSSTTGAATRKRKSK